ncbi:hypothetical protein POV27_17700 [Aureisphaera galaxeae]|uniref:C1q-like domain-containing protein n=1 Tax=Aureisphaera galaxeae TaxID=1538023 RepID=UPI0023508174|nr:hypothetical protein [Aureisphaera galaxeae]MDC8005892.1 hypothetical protein [Aureisphaera galaxeae]
MRKSIALLVVLCISYSGLSQVGINTTAPEATLDIVASDVASPSNEDGILIPRIDDFPTTDPTAAQDGMLVFATGNGTPSKGFYYWNNSSTSWISITGVSGSLDDAYDSGGAGSGRTIVADNGAVDIQGNGGLRVEDDINAAESIVHDGDADTFLTFTPDRIRLDAGGRNYIDIQHADTEIAFNEDSTQSDFRIESGTQANMFFLDGSADAIGIGQASPVSPLHVGIQTSWDLGVINTGQDGIYFRGSGDNSGLNAIGSSIGFGPPTNTRSNQRKAAIASIQTNNDSDQVGLGFFVHTSVINLSDMVEGMRLTHDRKLGINTTSPQASLDVRKFNSSTSLQQTDGVLIPQGNNFPSTNPGSTQDGMLVFINGDGTPSKGFYYWDDDSTSWVYLLTSSFTTPPAARVTADLQSIAASTSEIVEFDTETFDTQNSFDPTSFAYTVPEGGMYWINLNVHKSTGVIASTLVIEIHINGSLYVANDNATRNRNMKTLAQLATGDTIEVFANNTDSSAIDIGSSTNPTYTYLEIIKSN